MAEQHEITTTNQMVLNFNGAQTGGIGNLLVDDFSLSESSEDELAHGVSNFAPIGIKLKNTSYEFDLTLQGENASAANSVFKKADSRPDITIYALADDGMSWRIPHAWPNEVEMSGSDGDAIELSISGLCMEPERSG